MFVSDAAILGPLKINYLHIALIRNAIARTGRDREKVLLNLISTRLVKMSTYPPNPINAMGRISSCNIDKQIAKRARYLLGSPKQSVEKKKDVYTGKF